jgi:hypothetical protein
MTISEVNLNITLARLLEKRGLRAIGETVLHSGAYRPDILMTINGVRVILEGRFQKAGVEESLDLTCRSRLENALCDISVGVVYPHPQIASLSPTGKDVEQFLLGARYSARVFHISAEGIRGNGWEREIELNQLSSLIRSSYSIVVKEDRVSASIQHVREGLDEFAQLIGQASDDPDGLARSLVEVMKLPSGAKEDEEAEDE